MIVRLPAVLVLALVPVLSAWAAPRPELPLSQYFRFETQRVASNQLAEITTRADWEARRPALREQLLDMLGLWPMPERTDLKPVVTGALEHGGVTVEKLHFQSSPGLYVTANLYRPTRVEGKLPAVLYVCGHAQVKTNGLSCGNKTGYQHHGYWFARNGYVALLIDTLQLGEIEGVHHGTHRLGQWWWNSRGYTPAGVEAWNGIRALDYLESRPEVDASRIGMTGRSGGGSYTWTTAAIDERVRVAAPVAGITDLWNQVVDGVVEGHCDCMFFPNRHGWDFALNAALLAPRPLLIVNTDRDPIFPLDGVQRVHAQVRRVYDLMGVADRLGLVIAPGPHQDTQDLQVPVFRWFGQHLKGEETVVREPAVKAFDPLALRVFGELPRDERNTRAAEWFPDGRPTGEVVWEGDGWKPVIERMRRRVFAGWPEEWPPTPHHRSDWSVSGEDKNTVGWSLETQHGVVLPMISISRGDRLPKFIAMHVLSEAESDAWHAADRRVLTGIWSQDHERAGLRDGVMTVGFVPRGFGPVATPEATRQEVHFRRRFMLFGHTLDAMRAWDIRQAVRFLRQNFGESARLEIVGAGSMAVNVLLAGIYERRVDAVELRDLPASLRDGPDYPCLLEFGDVPWLRRLAEARGLEVR